MKKIFINIIFLALLINCSYADYDRKDDLQKQITVYNYEISYLNDLIKNNFNEINIQNQKLRELNNNIILLSSLISNGNVPKGDFKEKLISTEAEYIKYKEKIDKLKSDFKKKILWLYKNGTDYELEILFSSKSFNDFYTRLEYMNKISQLRKNDFFRISQEQLLFEEKQKILKMSKEEFDKYIKEKKDDFKQISDEKSRIENIIRLKKDENENYIRQIGKMEILISKRQNDMKMISEDFIYKTDTIAAYQNLTFDRLKGMLILPVQSLDIISDYGKSVDPATRSVIYNNGVDVSIAKGSYVKNVADGYVEDIIYIPLYGTTVIINHNNNYRTIYSILKEVNVALNDKVPAGKIIAKTGENLNGQSFHFELWHDTTPLDPKQWMKKGALVNAK